MDNIKNFFAELDREWKGAATSKIHLRILGSSALILQTDYNRGTKDADVLETADITASVKKELLELAGRGTTIHKRHRIYLDIVSGGIPFLPQSPHYIPLRELNRALAHFHVEVMDVVDVVVSKIKRFGADDVSDIRAMVERKKVPHAKLVERFKSAMGIYEFDARADELPLYIKNLNVVERDFMMVAESEIELPGWLTE